ncbi:hypothetical protein BsWGS_07496 [Bradybaena similaris]
MLIKCLLPKSSAFLGRQGKAISRLLSFTAKRFDKVPQNARIPWHPERHTCMLNVASPINIITGNTIQNAFDNFKFTGYDSPLKLVMANNGHTVTIDLPESQLKYTGGGMQDTYIAHHVHFHFSQSNSYGSEHFLDDMRFPMEMHMVHCKSSCKDIRAARTEAAGISVLVFLFRMSRTNNSNLNPIVDKLKEIVKPYSATSIEMPSIYSIFPHRDLEFYQYAEHFDKPTTHWTVFQKKIHISESQMNQFRKLTSVDTVRGTDDNVLLPANNRFVAHLPDLMVYRSSEASYKKRQLKHVVSGIFRKRTQGMVDL